MDSYRLAMACWEQYEVVNGLLTPSGERLEIRQLGDSCSYLEFGRIVSSGQIELQIEEMISFVRKYSLLGQTRIQDEPRLFQEPRRLAEADNLLWLLEHSANVARCQRLIAFLSGQSRSIENVRPVLRSIGKRQDDRQYIIPIGTKLSGLDYPDCRKYNTHRKIYIAKRDCQSLLTACLEPNLGAVSRKFEAGHMVFEFRSLIELIYWQLADLIGRRDIKSCLECEGIFLSSDGRQRYCTKRCGNRVRQRRFNSKNREAL